MEAIQQLSPEREAQRHKNQKALDLLAQMRTEGDDENEWQQMQQLLPRIALSLSSDQAVRADDTAVRAA